MTQLIEKLKIEKGATALAPTKNNRFRLIIAAATVLFFVLLLVVFIQGRATNVEVVSVSQVYPSRGFTLLNASGYVVARRKAAVAAKTTGRLEWLGVEEGSRVKAGEIVARLENSDLAASLEHARSAVQVAVSAVEQARAERADATGAFERQKELLKQGIVAKADYDAAEARYRRAVAAVKGSDASLLAAEATRRGAEIALDYSFIKAPFNGVVLTKNADIGDIITPLGAASNAKAAVVTIADLDSLEVEADVAESNLAQVKTGQPCEVVLDALPGVRFRAVVHTIVPTADRSKASVMVKVRFIDQDQRVLPEMSAKVAFLSRQVTQAEQQPRIAVNTAAVVGQGKDARVYRVVDGRIQIVPVSIGVTLGDSVEVGGIKQGEKLVLKPSGKLKQGSRVTVQER